MSTLFHVVTEMCNCKNHFLCIHYSGMWTAHTALWGSYLLKYVDKGTDAQPGNGHGAYMVIVMIDNWLWCIGAHHYYFDFILLPPIKMMIASAVLYGLMAMLRSLWQNCKLRWWIHRIPAYPMCYFTLRHVIMVCYVLLMFACSYYNQNQLDKM